MKTPLNGYIKIYRQILDWEWYDDVNTKAVFLHLILKASIEDTRWHGETVKRGELITSISQLSSELKLSVRSVRTALNHLKATNEIAIRTTPNYSVISVLSYTDFQDSDKQNDKRPTNDRQTTDKLTTNDRQHLKNNKNEKNNKNAKKDIYSSEFSAECDPETEKPKDFFDFQSVVSLFNSICKSLPQIRNLTENRKRKIRNADKQLNGDFKSFFEKVERSDFLSGRKTDWKASFDWIFTPQNLVKIVEGNYENKSNPQNSYSPNHDWGEGLPF